MGFRETIKRKRMEYAKQRAETKGYRRILAEKTKIASRQAYAKEAVKVAEQRAIAKARQPTLGTRIVSGISGRNSSSRRTARAISKKAARRYGLEPKKSSRRRTIRYAPVRKTTRRRTRSVSQPRESVVQAPRIPQSLNQAIYG